MKEINIKEPKRIRQYIDTHIWLSFCKLLNAYVLISNNLFMIIKNSICVDTINKIKFCKDHMYKSYEIKDLSEKLKYANYSLEKLKLIDNDIDFLFYSQILKYKQHQQLKESILDIYNQLMNWITKIQNDINKTGNIK